MRGRARAALVVVGAATLVILGVVVRGAVWGETLAAADDWRLVARASPLGASITHESATTSGGVGALARPGRLDEVLVHRPDGSPGVLFAGVLPEGAAEVRAPAAVTTRTRAVHDVVLTDFWVLAIERPPEPVELTAVDRDGAVVAQHRVTSPALQVPAEVPATPWANPDDLSGRHAPTRASTLRSVVTVGGFVGASIGFAALAAWARRRRRRGDEAGRTNAEGAEAMLHARGPWTT